MLKVTLKKDFQFKVDISLPEEHMGSYFIDLLRNGINNFLTGDTKLLDSLKVVVGGDQLTRVRLTGAKAIRVMAMDPKRAFVHLDPVIMELWHNKQDFLHASTFLR